MSQHGRGRATAPTRNLTWARGAVVGLAVAALGAVGAPAASAAIGPPSLSGTASAAAVALPGQSAPAPTLPGLPAPTPTVPGPRDEPAPVGETPPAGGGAGANAGAGGTTVDAGSNGGQAGGGQSGGGGGQAPQITIINYGGVFNSYQSAAAPGTSSSTPLDAYIVPFPIVHIRGRIAGSRARIERLAVSAPTGARATVTCRGGTRRGCPRTASRSRATSGSGYVRFRHVQRTLRSGAKIEVRVTKPGLIGKFTRFSVRSRKVPLRSDACLRPGASRSSRCS